MSANRTADPPQPRLERRPEAFVFALDGILDRARDGRVRIPSFARASTWTDSDRLDLFDSIYRGYPIGSLLFWRREAPAARIALGNLTLDAPARYDALWVVDGQQRITTLVDTLLVRPSLGERAIHFSLDAAEFVYKRVVADGTQEVSPSLPMSIVLDVSTLHEWLFAHPGIGASSRSMALEIGKRIREYQVPCYIVEAAEEQVLRTIFRRTNRAGRRLKEMDIFRALNRSRSPEQPSDLQSVAQDLGFGVLANGNVRAALSAVQGVSLDRDLTDGVLPDQALSTPRSTAAALREAIVFLRRDAGIVHAALLPSALPVVVLSRFFHAFPAPRDRSRLLLRRWLWRGALGGAVAGDARRHLACIRDDEEEPSVQRLLAVAGSAPSDDVRRLDAFHFVEARSKLQCCALASLGPRDLRTGAVLDVPALLSAGGDEKVTTLLRGKGKLAGGDRARGLANRILHPRMPTSVLVEAISTTDDERALASHAITREAQDALRARDASRFLALREASLQRVVDDHFRRQTEWGADDSPSLESLIVDED